MEKQANNKELDPGRKVEDRSTMMVEPIETVMGAIGTLEERRPKVPEIREMDENRVVVDAKPVVAVVSTVGEGSPPDFKSMVKISITTPSKTRKGKTTTKRQRKCKKGHRRNKKTHRCRKSVKKS